MTEPITGRPARDVAPRLTDYVHERATFRLEVPERFNPVLAIVESWAGDEPEAPAVLSLDADGDVVLRQSIGELAAETRRAARALLAAGVGKGDRVFIMLPRVPEWYAATLGAMRIGAIPMPGRNMLTAKDIKDRLIRGEAVAAITDSAGAQKVDDTNVDLRAKFRVGDHGRTGDWVDFAEAGEQAGDGETPQDPRRPVAAVLHQRHRVGSEDGPAPSVIRAGACRDGAVLARPASRRPALDGGRHGLGEGGLGRTVRTVVRAGVHRAGRARQGRRGHDLQHS